MSHTPGPWTDSRASDSQHNIDAADNTPVATAWRLESWPNTALEANARLIATSPELLELANRVASLNPDVGEIGPGMLAQLVSDARRIVAKTK